ncbi:Serine/threonine-protein kinase PknD [subsurface metagenome]
MAVDSSGYVYVAESWGGLIQKFDSSGNFILQWGVAGAEDVAVDSDGYVYVTNYSNSVKKYDSSGNFILQWGSEGIGDGQFNRPEGIAVDASGNIYVVDSFNRRIQKFDSSGNFILKWGSYGTGDGQFSVPMDVAVDASGNIYVVEHMDYQYNDRIQKFNSSGNFILKWGSWGTGDGQFKAPIGVAVDASGNIYVSDAWNYCVKKFGMSP